MTGDVARELAGRYRIVSKLGAGDTYEAVAESDGANVALKRLVLATTSDWKKADLVQRQAGVLASLGHPAIPKLRESFVVETETGPISYLAHDLAPGRSLRAWIEAGWRPDEGEIARIGDVLLEVLTHVHAAAVVHGGIEPENVIRADDGRLALVGFGAIHDGAVRGRTTAVATDRFLAPEQFRGAAMPASDVYGVGGTLLYLLGGRAPGDYPKGKRTADVRRHVRVSPHLAAFVERALRTAPERRFPGAAEALAALRGQRPIRRPTRRSSGRLLVMILALFAAAVFGIACVVGLTIGGVVAVQAWKARHAEPPAVRPLARLPIYPVPKRHFLVSPERFDETPGATITGFALSPDDKRLASANEHLIRLWDLDTRSVVADLPSHGGRTVGTALFTHDGAKLITAGGPLVRVASAADGTTTATIAVRSAWSVDLAPDDETLYASDGDLVRAFDVATQKSGRTFVHGSDVTALAVSADGTKLASGARDGSMKLWSLASGAQLSGRTAHTRSIAKVAFSPDGSLLATCGTDGLVAVGALDPTGNVAPRYEYRHRTECSSAEFSADGRMLASVGADGLIRVVDAANGNVLAKEHSDDPVTNVAFTRDGATLYASVGNAVKRYYVAVHGRGTPFPAPPADAPAEREAPDQAHALFLEAERHGVYARTSSELELAEKSVVAAEAIEPPAAIAAVARARLTIRKSYLGLAGHDGLAEAKGQLDMAAARGPKTVEWWATSAWLALAMKDAQAEREAVRQAKLIDPADLLTALVEGSVAESEHRYPNEIAIAVDIVKRTHRPDMLHGAYRLLETAFVTTGDLDAAEEAFRADIALDGRDPYTHSGYASFLADGGDVDGALAEARRAVELAPDGAEERNTLARVLAHRGADLLWQHDDVDGAAAVFEEAITTSPSEPTSYYGRAAVKRARALDRHDPGALTGARDDLQTAIMLNRKFGVARTALAELDRVEAAAKGKP